MNKPKPKISPELERFLAESSIKERLYHATGDDFSIFDPNKSSEEGKFGKGIYMTPNTKYANFFANIRSKQNKNAQIMPVYSSIKNPYKIHGQQNIPFNKVDSNKLQSFGHDGIFFYDDNNNLKEVVAFHPNQIKSAIGNRGTYDTSDPDITKAKGGLAHMGDGGSMYESVKNNIPAHVRWFGQTLFGDRSKPFTEKDLTSDEINQINRAIHNSENQKYHKHPGSVGYENYKMPGEGPNLNVESGTTNQPMSMTLGRFSYEKMPDGKVHVTDKYDFDNETRKKDVERYAGEHPVVRALDAGTKALGEALNFNLYGAASALGNAYIGKDGKPVSITYDPAQTNERYAPDFSGEGSYAQGGSMSLSQEQLEQLRQLRQKIKGYGELENQYDKETSKIPLKDLESFETWKAKRGIQHKADGGSMAGVNLYSPLNKSAESIPRTKGTGAEFMTELSKKPGFKKAEVEDRGLEVLHGLPKMTKEEFHAHLHSKPIPKINTKIIKDEFGALDTVLYDPDDFRRDRHWVVDRHGEPVTDEPFPTLGHAQEYILDHPELDTRTFHKHYKLPGGDNYQEHLYKYQPEEQKSFVANHGHFGAEPNVLASARTVDRKTPDGKKILHVEEIQSDWHQRGRDEGYKQNLSELPKNYKLEERYIDNKREYLVKDENGKVLSMGLFPESALHNALDNLNNGSRVPNAPFKKNWEEMVAKQLLKHAVDNGYHGIALTSGDEQADRYSLAKQVGQINYMPTTKQLIAYDHSGNPIIHENGVAPEDLDKYVGKEVADKLNKSEWEGSSRVLRGEDIKVGGEGMKSAYDKRIPNIFNDIGKKHGAKMQLHAMPVQKEAKYYAQMHDNGFGVFKGDEDDQLVTNHPNLEKANAKAKELNSTKLHYMDLTPELIEHIKKEGLPIYKKGGNVHVTGDLDTMKYELHMANGGSTLGQIMQPSLSQMKFEMSQRFNPLDIQNVGANEAPNMFPKAYVNPTNKNTDGFVPPGGVATPNGMPIGGVDQNPQQPGQQLTPQQPQQPAQPQGQSGQGVPPTQAPQQQPPMGNMLSLTPEGQAMNAMGGGTPQQPQHLADGGMADGGKQTVKDPQRNAFPGIYDRPDVIAAKAAAQVAPEDPALKKIFGVTREDLYQMGKNRVGNLPGDLPGMAKNPKGSAAAARVMGPENTQRILDAMSEAQKHHALVQGMDPWYIMDPMFQRMAHLIGVDAAKVEYNKMNHLMGMSSPGSEVLTEIPRGTAAYYLDKQGRFGEFVKHLGKAENKRTKRFPADVRNVPGHAYHKTAQAGPMEKYLTSGQMTMKTPKVPMYIQASGVPETGFQTATPVGDAHWSRAVGLADTRNWQHKEGEQVVPKGSVTNPEMSMLAPWWREEIAGRLGLESVPAQARAWGTFSPQTGVTTPIGAPKLELVAKKIMETAHRMGVSPETARDMVLMGKTYAGKKKGGNVKLHKDMDTMRLELTQRKKAK